MFALLFTLIGLALAVLPIVTFWRQVSLTRRIDALDRAVVEQRRTIDDLRRRLSQAEAPRVQARDAAAPAPPPSAAPGEPPPIIPARPAESTAGPVVPSRPVTPATPRPVAPPAAVPAAGSRPEVPAGPRTTAAPPKSPPPPPRRPIWASFDWEQLVGVRLFSAIAGIALVLAAIFFFRYSLDQGWLAPSVRVAIGVVVATALLVICELKVARRYRITADAMNAAAIAILFATFFAAHALWNLIPSTATFALLTVVTVLAVLLSIRHQSIFIAVLGLAGGFATPALLSTGENRPIPLFTYLLLLNVGLAWVAVRMKWPVLTLLTLVLTTVYQWGWVVRFLSASDLTLGMGIFLVFALTSFVALALGRRTAAGGTMEVALERSGLAASAMPLLFALFLSAVPRYGVNTGLLFGFLLIVTLGLSAVAIAQREGRLHAMGGLATLLVFAIWLATSYASSAWRTVVAFVVAFGSLYAVAPMVAARFGRPFSGIAVRTTYVAPILLFVFATIVRIEPETAVPYTVFGAMFVVLALVAWRAFVLGDAGVYFVGALFAIAVEASWSAAHFTPQRLWTTVGLYSGFALFYLGVPMAWRRAGRVMLPRWGAGAVLIASLPLLLFVSGGEHRTASLWALALLLAILDAGLFIESAAGGLPPLSAAGGVLSWLILAVWWAEAGAIVGVLPSLLVVVGLTLIMLAGHAWAARQSTAGGAPEQAVGFRQGRFLGLVGHLFLFYVASNPTWAQPPWPILGALTAMTLATTATALSIRVASLHAAGVIAAALVVFSLALTLPGAWAMTILAAAEAVAAYAVGSLFVAPTDEPRRNVRALGAVAALFVTELSLIGVAHVAAPSILPLVTATHVANLSLILWLAWQHVWPQAALAAVVPAWLATFMWQTDHGAAGWRGTLALAGSLYLVFAAYPLILNRRAVAARGPYLTAIFGSIFFFVTGREALLSGNLRAYIGAIPVLEGLVMALTLRNLLRLETAGQRDLGRLALVAATSLGFATVAIPMQLSNQWITIGWALEGAALAWLYRRVPHKGLLYAATALLAVVFVRLIFNPAVFLYEPRGTVRLLNWYLYAYATCAAAMFVAARWLRHTDDRVVAAAPRTSTLLVPAAVVVLFLLLNIEVADFYATGPEITFRFGADVAQDLTYTLAWLVFGMTMLAVGIYAQNRYGRIAALVLIAVTTSKAFLYDLGSLGGLYRVGSLVGLAASLALVALALQRFVLLTPKEQS